MPYAEALNMPDYLTCLTGFQRCPKFLMCQGSEYGMVVYARDTKISKSSLICLNMAEYY